MMNVTINDKTPISQGGFSDNSVKEINLYIEQISGCKPIQLWQSELDVVRKTHDKQIDQRIIEQVVNDCDIKRELEALVRSLLMREDKQTIKILPQEDLPASPLMNSETTIQNEVTMRPVEDIFQEIISKSPDLNGVEKGFLEKKVHLMLSAQDEHIQGESDINEAHISIIRDVISKYLEKRECRDFKSTSLTEDVKVNMIFQRIIGQYRTLLTEFDKEDIEDRVCEALDIRKRYNVFGFSKEQVEACKTPDDIQKLMIEFHERVIREEIKEYLEFKEIIQKTIEEYPFENLLESSDKINIENRIREVVRIKEEEVGFEFDIEEAESYKEFINQEIKEYLKNKEYLI